MLPPAALLLPPLLPMCRLASALLLNTWLKAWLSAELPLVALLLPALLPPGLALLLAATPAVLLAAAALLGHRQGCRPPYQPQQAGVHNGHSCRVRLLDSCNIQG